MAAGEMSQHQRRIDSYYNTYHDDHRVARISSHRLKLAVRSKRRSRGEDRVSNDEMSSEGGGDSSSSSTPKMVAEKTTAEKTEAKRTRKRNIKQISLV